MTGSYWFDGSRVLDAVRAGLRDGLNEAGDNIAANARQRAPIRKVFNEQHGYRRKFRALSGAAKNQAGTRSVRYYFAQMSAATHSRAYARSESKMLRSVGSIRSSRVQLYRRGSANTPANSRTLRHLGTETNGRFTSASGSKANRAGGYEPNETLLGKLTSRGKYEVRSGRAIHREVQGEGHTTSVQIGGALKASIGNEGVTETPNGSKVTVSAAIRYAKFVEFPTIHNAAQPFLLPALHDERGKLVGTIASAIRKNLGG